MSRNRRKDSTQQETQTSALAEDVTVDEQAVDISEEAVVEEEQQAIEEATEEVVDLHSEAARGLTHVTSPVDESPFVAEPVVETKQIQPSKAGVPMSKLEQELTIYQEKIRSKVTAEETGKLQYGLFNVIRGVLGKEDQGAARDEWNSLLKFANKNADAKTGAFNEYYLFRGAEAWPGSPVEYTAFRRIAWLIIQTADPKTRKANANAVNLNTIVTGLRPNEVTNLINFYS